MQIDSQEKKSKLYQGGHEMLNGKPKYLIATVLISEM